MLVDFDLLPPNSRIWIYQCTKELSSETIKTVSGELNRNIENWASHGSPLQGGFKFLNSRMLVIGNNPEFNSASGCSIDSSTAWLKQILTNYNIDFFDRNQAYFSSEKTIQTFSIFEAKKAVLSGLISPETVVLNNQITQKAELAQNWTIKASESYLKKYFEGYLIENQQ